MQDINPGFPISAGRTPLARVRTFLAGRRSLFAHYRTLLAKSRTGLAFIRTGIAAITIALLFLRILGDGPLLLLEIPLLVSGCIMVYDGLKWYLPARKIHADLPACTATEPTGGTNILEVLQEESPVFSRTTTVAGAAELRARWNSLAPVMRRRFLASDRTDLAEERTLLACYRTRMAKARTGLAFARTGISLVSLGLALIRYFHLSTWLILDLGLIGIGAIMSLEGFLWYVSGRRAGMEGFASVRQGAGMAFIRTGLSVLLIGVVFAISFNNHGFGWLVFEVLMISTGILLIIDGFIWSIPAERIKKEFPYCYGDLEIVFPDYGMPARFWKKAVFNNAQR